MITIIIDGYNFIFNSYFRINIKSEELQELRNSTINLLSKYYNVKKNKVIVVFDGYKTNEPIESRYDMQNIEVIYSKTGEKADQVIMRMANTAENALVVTNDNEIKRYVEKTDHASCISPEEFKALIHSIMEEDDRYSQVFQYGDDSDKDDIQKSSKKKKGNPYRLSKKERLKLQKIKKL
jgi:predicted RNA-binding protein with PIN domain